MKKASDFHFGFYFSQHQAVKPVSYYLLLYSTSILYTYCFHHHSCRQYRFESVVLLFQISSHVKAIDAIYQGTDFMGIRNISFMVKRIRVSLSLILSLRLRFGPYFPLNSSWSSFVDKHHQWREGQVQPVPLRQHRGWEVPGAELGAEPWRLLLGLRFHRQRFWWRGVGFGLGWSPLRYWMMTHSQCVLCEKRVQKKKAPPCF